VIAEEPLKAVYRPAITRIIAFFYRSKKTFKGTGLGRHLYNPLLMKAQADAKLKNNNLAPKWEALSS